MLTTTPRTGNRHSEAVHQRPIGSPLATKLDTRSERYQANLTEMQTLWDAVASELDSVPSIGGQRYVDRHRKRGKLLARERIEELIDPNTPFLELGPLAGWGTQDSVGVGLVTGIGIIEGVQCAIYSTDMTVSGWLHEPQYLDQNVPALGHCGRQPVTTGHADRISRCRATKTSRSVHSGRWTVSGPG